MTDRVCCGGVGVVTKRNVCVGVCGVPGEVDGGGMGCSRTAGGDCGVGSVDNVGGGSGWFCGGGVGVVEVGEGDGVCGGGFQSLVG